VANRLAAREGLELPIPFTRRYPGLPEANEDEWQEVVIRHVGVNEWVRHDKVDEVDLLGPIATASLRRRGLLWPPLAHTRQTELELARGGSLLSGEGGDEVLGPRRLTPLRQLLGRSLPVSRPNLRQVGLELAPRSIRRERYRRRFTRAGFNWLREDVREAFVRTLATEAAADPLSWGQAARRHPHIRGIRIAMETLDLLATEATVVRANPLLSPGFLAALSSMGGRLGFTDRTTALRILFSGLLPEAVLTRTTKCRFNRAVFGQHSRSFVERWTGDGVDPELVDADVLRQMWSAEEPHALTFPLLQSCWLATEGVTPRA
jgi:asparagine synthase (glutamine-hydrolysing)